MIVIIQDAHQALPMDAVVTFPIGQDMYIKIIGVWIMAFQVTNAGRHQELEYMKYVQIMMLMILLSWMHCLLHESNAIAGNIAITLDAYILPINLVVLVELTWTTVKLQKGLHGTPTV